MESISAFESEIFQQTGKSLLYQGGDHIFVEGQPSNGSYYIVDNYAKILKRDRNGNNLLMWYAHSTELIGLISFFQELNHHTHSAVVGEYPCKIVFLSDNELRKILGRYPRIKHKLIKMLCERIRFAEERTKNMLYHSTEKRVVATLFLLASKENKQTNVKNTIIRHTAQELAAFAGASLKATKKSIKGLKNKELIDHGMDWFLIKNPEKLKQFSNSHAH